MDTEWTRLILTNTINFRSKFVTLQNKIDAKTNPVTSKYGRVTPAMIMLAFGMV